MGRLARDVDLRSTQSGKQVALFTIACNKPKIDGQQQQADFINCVAWNKLAEVVSQYLSKGSQVLVEGRLQTRSYEAQDNSKRYATEVIVRDIEFVGSKPQGQSQEQDSGAGSFGSEVISDEEIPW